MFTRRLLLLILFITAAARAQTSRSADLERGDFEKMLVPITVVNWPGDHGSRWTTRFEIANTSPETVELLPWNCTTLAPCSLAYPLPPRTTVSLPLIVTAPGEGPGRLLYVTKARADDVAFNLRIQDVSRQSETWGTELPVVRERQFRTGVVFLLGVPLTSEFRQSLRIYAVDTADPIAFAVRFFALGSGRLDSPVAELTLLTSRVGAGGTSPWAEGIAHSAAELHNISAVVPQLRGIDRVMIEVEPLTSGSRFWAFVSVTNNATQHVTAITPTAR